MALVFLWSFAEGAYVQMSENIKTMITGDLQIYPEGAPGLYNVNRMIKQPGDVEKILKKIPAVTLIVPRVVASGLVSSADQSVTTFIVGSDPRREKELSQRDYIVAGRELRLDDDHAIVIGKPMAKQLKVSIGDKIVLVAQDRYGSLSGEAFRLIGIFETGSDQIDNTTVHLLLPVVQRLLSYETEITKFLIRTDPREPLEQVTAQLRERLVSYPLQISRWEEVTPMLAQLVEFDKQMIFVILLIVITVVSTGVLNTLVMSFIERIREFGLMKSLGTKDSVVAGVLLFESFLLTLIGCFVGVSGGLALAFYFRYKGISLTGFAEGFSNLFIGHVIYPHPRLVHVIITVSIVLLANLFVSIFPAWRASRLQPIEAMRQAG